MKKLNMQKFKELNPCEDGYKYVLSLKTTDLRSIFDSLESHNLEWANWLVARLLFRKDKIRYAIFASEQVIDSFESKYPDDKRPRQAIDAARAVLVKNNITTRAAAGDAAWTARAAAGDATRAAAWAAGDAAWAAGDAAWAAAWAASRDAGAAAGAAGDAAWAAARAASRDAGAAAGHARYEMKLKIVEYGLSLLGVEAKS